MAKRYVVGWRQGARAMRITGTFLDEISHDIPSQNWGAAEWRRDFALMRAVGIDTVILIRCGHKRWTTFPSETLRKASGAFSPPVDLVRLFLGLAEEQGMRFYFGTYDSGRLWHEGRYREEIDISRDVVSEAWERYGSSTAFRGFYLSCEASELLHGIIDIYAELGRHCKRVSGGLPVMISPYIAGRKAVDSSSATLARAEATSVERHERQWEEILSGIRGAVDTLAFQDGHVDFDELPEYLAVNRDLARRHGMQSWSNLETFDRDMPIKFLPIKWEKLLLKLRAAEGAGLDKVITFEFSHFLSPHSAYAQARGLFARYCEHLGIEVPTLPA
jgi:hypothetical protein